MDLYCIKSYRQTQSIKKAVNLIVCSFSVTVLQTEKQIEIAYILCLIDVQGEMPSTETYRMT